MMFSPPFKIILAKRHIARCVIPTDQSSSIFHVGSAQDFTPLIFESFFGRILMIS